MAVSSRAISVGLQSVPARLSRVGDDGPPSGFSGCWFGRMRLTTVGVRATLMSALPPTAKPRHRSETTRCAKTGNVLIEQKISALPPERRHLRVNEYTP